ncbi:MAG: dTDP-4-dehydrorhamnose 3,5-epimerase family protein [Anaerohalosphaeraceae bacterium]|nr:dTDP-4-dehydrorhamnose 3,5-epimerase family protein [Anaerohalosphaeraceae bacterium]
MKKKVAALKKVFADESLIIFGSNGLIEGVKAKRTKVIPDERGRLGEILRCDDPFFEKFGQSYFTTTFPGVVKAWHYHKIQTDNFYVVKGTVKVALYDNRKDSKTYRCVNQVYLSEHCPAILQIPPGVYHGWMCIGDTQAYIINITTEAYNYAVPDEHRLDPHDNDIPYDWTRKDG